MSQSLRSVVFVSKAKLGIFYLGICSIKMSIYLENSEGKFIPATKRPDGTWRKARRVKDGYVPQEEVPLYESKGKQFVAQRQTGVPPGMCPVLAAESKKEREKQERTRAKKMDKEVAKNSKSAAPSIPIALTTSSNTTKVNQSSVRRNVDVLAKTLDESLKLDDSQEVDSAKIMKKLRKKIREIEQIESRIRAGEQKKLDKDQLEKVKKKAEILKQIKTMEQDDPTLRQS